MQYTSGANAVVFEQVFPEGVNGTSLGETGVTSNLVTSSFPSFQVSAGATSKGYVGYNGPMVGSQPLYGEHYSISVCMTFV